MTDKELEKIYNEAYRAVYWTAMSLLKNEDDAQDVVQDTFVTAFESYDKMKNHDNVTAWLKKIAANKCLNRLTRTRTVNTDDEVLDNIETVPEDFLPDSIIESAEKRKILMDIIERSLSEDIRRTLILFYFNELSTKEIASAMGIPQGTVLSRLNLAKKKIKKEVEKYEEENNDKLFAMATPFLSKLFQMEAEQVPFRPMPTSLINLSASNKVPLSGASSKAAAVTKAAVKKGTGIMLKKLIIGVASVAIVGTAATVGIVHVVNKDDSKNSRSKEIQEVETVSEASDVSVVFDDTTIDTLAMTETDGNVTETTAAVPTLMPYEDEEGTWPNEGENLVKFGSPTPFTYTDPIAGIELEGKIAGNFYYDLDEGATIDEEELRASIIECANIRAANALAFAGYGNITGYYADVQKGIAYDLRQDYPIHNVSVNLFNIVLTEESKDAYNEATGENG